MGIIPNAQHNVHHAITTHWEEIVSVTASCVDAPHVIENHYAKPSDKTRRTK